MQPGPGMDGADDLSASSILSHVSLPALHVVLEGVFPVRLTFLVDDNDKNGWCQGLGVTNGTVFSESLVRESLHGR